MVWVGVEEAGRNQRTPLVPWRPQYAVRSAFVHAGVLEKNVVEIWVASTWFEMLRICCSGTALSRGAVAASSTGPTAQLEARQYGGWIGRVFHPYGGVG